MVTSVQKVEWKLYVLPKNISSLLETKQLIIYGSKEQANNYKHVNKGFN